MVNKNNTSNPYAYNQLGQVQNPSTNPYANQISRDPYANRQYMPGAHTHSVVNGPLQSPIHTSTVATPKDQQYSIA